ncbi:MAG: D-tyrosyl-tRNA(Tyr) deacylase [Flavobacteriaceae bacterium]|nr:D-tyrosyl-tRNA(Tyr) deacylase [Flavobacteriaceae bacterium]
MKLVVQRVKKSNLKIKNKLYSSINTGMVILIGISKNDNYEMAKELANKIIKLRIFNDDNGKMNKNIMQIKGEVLVVSQFTLYADTNKGNRPSFINAAKPELAISLYNHFIDELQKLISSKVRTGKFGADMKIELINDGPVTIILEKN